MGAVDERAAAILQLLFHAPGDLPGWRAFYEAFQDAISPGGRVVTLVETVHPVPSTILFALEGQVVAPGLLPRRTEGKPRIETLPAGAMFELPYMGPGSQATRCCRSCSSPTACAPARLSASCWDAKARASGPC